MYGSIDSSTSRRTGGPNRRRISSFSSAFRMFSVSSSSTSRSSLRVTRNAWWASTSIPGKSSSRCAPITSSSGTYRSGDASRNRDRDCGTFTRAKCLCPDTGLRTTTARLRLSPDMYGKGCAGSTARGVRTGKIFCRNSVCSRACSLSASSDQRTSSMPSDARSGSTSCWNAAACRAMSSRDLFQIWSSTSRGCSPAAERVATPVAIRRLRPATRTMKNSSRLLAKIARNLVRSSNGMSGSSASSRTRSLNASQLRSRSRNRPSGSSSRSSSSTVRGSGGIPRVPDISAGEGSGTETGRGMLMGSSSSCRTQSG